MTESKKQTKTKPRKNNKNLTRIRAFVLIDIKYSRPLFLPPKPSQKMAEMRMGG